MVVTVLLLYGEEDVVGSCVTKRVSLFIYRDKPPSLFNAGHVTLLVSRDGQSLYRDIFPVFRPLYNSQIFHDKIPGHEKSSSNEHNSSCIQCKDKAKSCTASSTESVFDFLRVNHIVHVSFKRESPTDAKSAGLFTAAFFTCWQEAASAPLILLFKVDLCKLIPIH